VAYQAIDSQIAAQQDKIAKQAADYEELKERLNEVLYKVCVL
jgi:tetrahydromethanopterin S-methyltransferase subunit G